jgi:hypothetical protein
MGKDEGGGMKDEKKGVFVGFLRLRITCENRYIISVSPLLF